MLTSNKEHSLSALFKIKQSIQWTLGVSVVSLAIVLWFGGAPDWGSIILACVLGIGSSVVIARGFVSPILERWLSKSAGVLLFVSYLGFIALYGFNLALLRWFQFWTIVAAICCGLLLIYSRRQQG